MLKRHENKCDTILNRICYAFRVLMKVASHSSEFFEDCASEQALKVGALKGAKAVSADRLVADTRDQLSRDAKPGRGDYGINWPER